MRSYSFWLKGILFFLLSKVVFASAPYSYSYTPKYLFKNQLFPVTVLVKHYNPKDPPRFEYDIVNVVQPINIEPIQVINRDEAFYTFYFKTPNKGESLELPPLSIWNLQQTYMLHSITIKIKEFTHVNTHTFCNVLASNLRINHTKIDTFDSNNSLVTLNVEATEANLEDMHIPNSVDDGIENLTRDGAKAMANYYFIVPSNKKKIAFTYYNLIKNSFSKIKIDLQSNIYQQHTNNLSPKELNFDAIKKYTLIIATVIFFLLAYTTRDYLYILLFVILFAMVIYFYMPNKSICVQEGTSLYILPTNNSSISTQLNQNYTTEVLTRYRQFYKIDYNGVKGWIKNENLCKN